MKQHPEDVVFTGFGVACNLGDDLDRIIDSLRTGRGKPFVRYSPQPDFGVRCRIIGAYEGDVSNDALGISKQQGRFMGRASRLALKAARAAIAQSGVDERDAAVIVGSGTGDVSTLVAMGSKMGNRGHLRRVSPAVVPRIMSSTVSANLATVLRVRGPSCGLTAACASGAFNIVMAALLIRSGAVEKAVAGGVDVVDPHFFAGFDSMGGLNQADNDSPGRASRPYAADREGFVFGEGAGIVVLERRGSAERRGASVLGVLCGFGMSSDGTGNMVQPAPDGGLRAMSQALKCAGVRGEQVEYVNTHGTSTPLGDVGEMHAIRELLQDRHVAYSSTKGYTGHTVSGAGAIEAIFTVEMLRTGFIAPSINATPLDAQLADYPPVATAMSHTFEVALSNSFGFGGTNASLVLGR